MVDLKGGHNRKKVEEEEAAEDSVESAAEDSVEGVGEEAVAVVQHTLHGVQGRL